MTTSLRDARICAVLSFLATASGVYFVLQDSWWWVGTSYVALLLAWCERRLRADHRRQLARHQRARRAAGVVGQGPAVPMPCCRLWVYSHGESHGRDCTRHTTDWSAA